MRSNVQNGLRLWACVGVLRVKILYKRRFLEASF